MIKTNGYEEKIAEYVRQNDAAMIADLERLMRIDSAYTEEGAGGKTPFGPGSAAALCDCAELLSGYGFPVKNYDNYVITADLGEGERELDMLAHLDVVPGGEGWTVTEAFKPKIVDNLIYGRGSADDKGPAIAAIYAMRAIKDLGIPLKKNVRLILGGCEELGLGDLEYYFEREPHAKYSFSPDADYPLINAERGISGAGFGREFTEAEAAESPVKMIDAGLRRNMVPAKAKAEFCTDKPEKLAEIAAKVAHGHGAGVEIATEGCKVSLTILGKGGHASLPEGSINSLAVLLEIIGATDWKDSVSEMLRKVSKVYPFGAYHGEAAGIDMCDEESGHITSCLNVMKYENGKLYGVIDSRVPAMATKENFNDVLEAKLKATGAQKVEISLNPCHLVSADCPLVKKLLASYEKIMGVKGEPIAIGGGTYVHTIENGVAFGCAMPGVDNRMHGPDEFMDLDVLRKSVLIFADAIISICG